MHKVGIPRFGNYHVIIGFLVRKLLKAEPVYAPPTTKKTLDLGQKHSPDFVCAPFKMIIGNMIETLEKGADTLIGIGGLCRLSYYAELQEQILKDLGHKFYFINTNGMFNSKEWFDCLKPINPDFLYADFVRNWIVAMNMTKKLDEIEEYIRQNAGFEVIKGSLDKILNNFIDALDKVNENIEVNNAYNFAKEELSKVELKIPSNPIKVAIIGEMYEVLDQYANHFLEKELANYNIIVYRDLALSRMMFKDIRPEILKKLQPYVKYEAGASTVYTIDQALKYAKEHIDGIIHLKSFGCTPECDMMPVIQNIAQDYKIPVLFLSKDTQTSTTGLKTRLEAFVDMLIRKK